MFSEAKKTAKTVDAPRPAVDSSYISFSCHQLVTAAPAAQESPIDAIKNLPSQAMISPIYTVEAARVTRTEKCRMRKTFSIVVEVFWEQMNKAMN